MTGSDRGRTGIFRIEPDVEGMKVVRNGEVIDKNYHDYLHDESNTLGSGVEAIFFPLTIAHVAAAVRRAREDSVRITLSGGRTGICAGAVPEGGYLLSLDRMKTLHRLVRGPQGYEITLDGGIRLNELVEMLRKKDLSPAEQDTDALDLLLKEKNGFVYPPDPTETTATVGGTVATNASGARTFSYGPTRNYVTGLELVLPTGELLRIRRGDIFPERGVYSVPREGGEPLVIPAPRYSIPATKHTAGFYSIPNMDLIDLFIGSEGVLGIIATVTVRLVEEPPGILGAVAFFEGEEEALSFVKKARAQTDRPLALEYFDESSLTLLEEARRSQGTISEIPEVPDAGGAVYFELIYESQPDLEDRVGRWRPLVDGNFDVWGALTLRDVGRMKTFRHTLPETVNAIISERKRGDSRIHKVGTDMAVPDDHLEEMMHCYRHTLQAEGLQHLIFGHIGNNHLHVNMLPASHQQLLRAKELYRTFARKAVSLGGTISAEHGIGRIKKEYLPIQFDREALSQMRAIKDAIDPSGLLNPGVLF